MFRTFSIIVLLGALSIAGIIFGYEKYAAAPTVPAPVAGGATITIRNATLTVDLAESEDEQVQGLGGRESLGDNEGMLFIWKTPRFYGIWMKNMKFPIDVIWLDDTWRVVRFETNVSPDTYPKIFYPQAPSLYVLETNAGWIEKNNIQPYDIATFSKND